MRFKFKKIWQKGSTSLNENQSYFKKAETWADDIYIATVTSRNRYKLAFLASMGLSALLTLGIIMMIPLQHTELVVVHEGIDGYTWISTTGHTKQIPQNWLRTRAEIAHYVSTRESYDPLLYSYQTKEVSLLSSPEVKAEYELSQSSDDKSSPISVLGDKGYRTVIVSNIMPIDSEAKNNANEKDHQNIAQIDYVVIDHFFGDSSTIRTPYSALISWKYNGVPNDPQTMLQNWDGFTITKFIKQPINTNISDT